MEHIAKVLWGTTEHMAELLLEPLSLSGSPYIIFVTYHDFIAGWLKMSRSSPSQGKGEKRSLFCGQIVDAAQTQGNSMESKHKVIFSGSICVMETRPKVWNAQMFNIQEEILD